MHHMVNEFRHTDAFYHLCKKMIQVESRVLIHDIYVILEMCTDFGSLVLLVTVSLSISIIQCDTIPTFLEFLVVIS